MSARNIPTLLSSLYLAALLIFNVGCRSSAIKPRVDYQLRKVAFQIGNTQIHAHVAESGSNHQLAMVNLHEDEQTSVRAGEVILEKYGGRLIRLVHSGKRRVVFALDGKEYSFDPNRIFSRVGVRKTLRGDGMIPEKAYEAVDQFAEQFIHYFALKKGNGIITLHNNGEGSLSIHTYEPGGEWAADTDELSVASEADPDNFYFVTDKRFFEEFKKQKFNVILQDNSIRRDDGSLSVFAGRHKIPYINVEAQGDQLAEQIRMLDLAVKLAR